MAAFNIGTLNIYKLFYDLNIQLVIPDYQRPYVWREEHINDLLEDWKDHFFDELNFKDDALEYFMGSIMIHNNNGVYEVIDGQQRLTTLYIIMMVLKHDPAYRISYQTRPDSKDFLNQSFRQNLRSTGVFYRDLFESFQSSHRSFIPREISRLLLRHVFQTREESIISQTLRDLIPHGRDRIRVE